MTTVPSSVCSNNVFFQSMQEMLLEFWVESARETRYPRPPLGIHRQTVRYLYSSNLTLRTDLSSTLTLAKTQ